MGWKFNAWFRASHTAWVSRLRPKLKATQHMAIQSGKRKPEEWFCGRRVIAEGRNQRSAIRILNVKEQTRTNRRRIADSRRFSFCSPLYVDAARDFPTTS
jgi:hypothetical protein